MFLKRIEKLPPKVKKVLKKSSIISRKIGCSIYLVGGIVRDFILKKDNFDLDIVVEGDGLEFAHALADHYKANFRKHHSFGTATVYFKDFKIDIATARREVYAHPGALPGVTPAGLKEDILRRDFSINSMAVSLNRADYGVLIDYERGYNDLKKGIIRILHDGSFRDDPTRMFRAIRFRERFGFRLAVRTRHLLKRAVKAGALVTVNEQRIRDELALIFAEEHPSRCIGRIDRMLGWEFFGYRFKLAAKDLKLIRHLDEALVFWCRRRKGQRPLDRTALYFAALFYRLSQTKFARLADRFGLRKGERRIITLIRKYYRSIGKVCAKDLSAAGLHASLKSYPPEVLLFCLALYHQDRTIRGNLRFFLKRLFDLTLKVRGRDLKALGFTPDQAYSKVLSKLLHQKIEKDLRSRRQELKELKNLAKDHLRNG